MFRSSRIWYVRAACVLSMSMVVAVSAAERRGSGVVYFQEDFPFQGACITAKGPGTNVAMKGFAIRVGNDANMLWDTDLLRFAAGWKGGYLTSKGVAYDGSHGTHPGIVGEQLFGTKPGPGWANANGEFADNRPEPFGPLPKEWCRWDGMYVNGSNVLLTYTVFGSKIMEQPSSVALDGLTAFVRTFKIENARADLATVIADGTAGEVKSQGNSATLTEGTNTLVVTLVGAPRNVKLSAQGARVVLTIRQRNQGCALQRRHLVRPAGKREQGFDAGVCSQAEAG